MGVERLRKHVGIETVIITGENSGSVKARAEKLKMTEYYLGVKDKLKVLEEIKRKNNITEENIAYIGDDVNDIAMMKLVGLTATRQMEQSLLKILLISFAAVIAVTVHSENLQN